MPGGRDKGRRRHRPDRLDMGGAVKLDPDRAHLRVHHPLCEAEAQEDPRDGPDRRERGQHKAGARAATAGRASAARRAASVRLSHGSMPSGAGRNTGIL
uniref:Uncharacterized protein n=1 Tax=Cereibacter sphaeroides (strain ATCC 17025 / ATH 2.4.3) TaxID=349102 RepID=A4WYB8_CERS5